MIFRKCSSKRNFKISTCYSRNDKFHEVLEASVIRKKVQKNFLNFDEVVAYGCAVFGASLSPEVRDMTGLQLNDLTDTSFSLDKTTLSVTPTNMISQIVRKKKLKEIITKSHTIPAKMKVTYLLEKSFFQTRKPSLIIYEGVRNWFTLSLTSLQMLEASNFYSGLTLMAY